MAIRTVQFTSREKASRLPPDPRTAVISITDPGTPEASLDSSFRFVLRLSFLDAVPADDYLPAPAQALFDHGMARQVGEFVRMLHKRADEFHLVVHCEQGVSRSAAIALFAEAYTGAPLMAREFACNPNPWVIDKLYEQYPGLTIDLPIPTLAKERRVHHRTAAGEAPAPEALRSDQPGQDGNITMLGCKPANAMGF